MVQFLCLAQDVFRHFVELKFAVDLVIQQPVAQELFVIGIGGDARLIPVRIPIPARVRCEDLVCQDQVSLPVLTKLKLGIRDDQSL